MTRADLEMRWLTLTRKTLPALAPVRRWPIRNDHCFQRILLDAACGECWYDEIAGRPAYRHATDAVLEAAINYALHLIDGSAKLSVLNARSLRCRGKIKDAAR